jgi:hypothetical protein
VTAVVSAAIIVATDVMFFHVTMIWRAFGYFAGAAGLGMGCFFLLGVAVTTAVLKVTQHRRWRSARCCRWHARLERGPAAVIVVAFSWEPGRPRRRGR